jgi:hypothetical protein
MDPLTMAVVTVVVASVRGGARVAGAYAEARTVRARLELVRAAAVLPPGTEISGTGRGGTWTIKVPAATATPTGGEDRQHV